MTSPDSPRRRRELLLEAQALAQATDRLEDELVTFRERDLPAFAAWFAGRLTTERRTIARLDERLARLTERHNDIFALVSTRGITPDHARAILTLEERAFATAAPAVREHLARERRDRRAYVARDFDREVRARTAPEAPLLDAPRAGPAAAPASSAAITSAYRRVARRLHPDAASDPRDEPETRWRARSWRALQDARARGDLATITALDLVARVRQFDCADFSADEARRAHACIRRDHDAATAEVTLARRSLAWGFGAGDAAAALPRVRAELRAVARELRAEIARLADDPGAPASTRVRPTTLEQLSFFE